MRRFITTVCLLGIALANAHHISAADPTIKFTGVVPGQAYEFIYNADGTATLRSIPVVAVGGNPNPNPTPTPIPSPNPTLAAKVRTLTLAALAEGGSPSTAVTLAGVYSVVADQVEAGAVTPAQAPSGLQFLSNAVIPASEVAAWTKWRTGVGDAMTGLLTTKATTVSTLRSVEQGAKSAVDGSLLASGEKAIDWQEWFKIILPLLLQLLSKWLNPMGM